MIRCLPKGFGLFLGRRLGDMLYYFDVRHKATAYSNVRAALGPHLSPAEIKSIVKGFYRNFGQNLTEILFIPLIGREYLNKYINIAGADYIQEAFKRGKGVIFLAVHEGSWELSNVICAGLGFPFVLFVRSQRYPRLNELLNSYRMQKGCRIIRRDGQMRQVIEALKNNESIGMTCDQGGKNGIPLKFFGKEASWATGAIRLALKYDAAILPIFYVRINGAYHKVIIGPAFKIKKTGNPKTDIRDNLAEIIRLFERYILTYPKEYLWTYKIWKYSGQKRILILSDAKAGHLRQSQAVAKTLSDYLRDKGISGLIETREVVFKSKFSKQCLAICGSFSGKYTCQGCLWCLRKFLREDSYKSLIGLTADIIISCGSSVAAVNYILSAQNQAKSVVIMRPSLLSMKRFNLVVMPRHDNPPRRKNVVVTQGALNLIDEDYLKEASRKLIGSSAGALEPGQFYAGLLIGGDTRDFYLRPGLMKEVISQLKRFAQKENAKLLVSTSRRTSCEIEELLKKEFRGYAGLGLLVIANENNSPYTVGGILGLSKIVVVSPESISMVSEAASAGCYTIVFKSGVDKRHRVFLNYLADKKYIHLAQANELSSLASEIAATHPAINRLEDRIAIRDALKGVI